MSEIAETAARGHSGSRPDRGPPVPARWGGIAVALGSTVRRLIPLVLSATLLPACITESIRIEAPANSPPSIESANPADNPLNEIIRLEPVVPDGGVEGQLIPPLLQVVVRDADVDQDLSYLVFIDDRATGPDDFGDVLTTGEPTRRLDIVLPLANLMARGCHRVELFVSSQFGCFPMCTGRPDEPGDVGTAVWWVTTRPILGDTSVVDMTTNCPPSLPASP